MATALITGASSGIGKEFAEVFAKNKYDLILVARREDRMNKIKKELEAKYGVKINVIKKDLCDENSSKEIFETAIKLGTVDVLVNNAGFGDEGYLIDQSYEKITQMIDLNVRSLTQLTKLFAEYMSNNKNDNYSDDVQGKKNKSIINVASISGFIAYPLYAVYCATKSYVISFSCALSNELKNKGVSVICLCPGATESEFFEVAGSDREARLMSATDVAEAGFKAMQNNKLIVIPGFKNKIKAFIARHIPINVAVKLLGRKMK